MSEHAELMAVLTDIATTLKEIKNSGFLSNPNAASFTAGAAASMTAPGAMPAPSSTPIPPAAVYQAAPMTVPQAATAAPPTVIPAGSVELDSAGMPWDERIHARTKSKIENGTWRIKRGVSDAEVAAVRAAMGLVPAAAPVAAAPANVTTPVTAGMAVAQQPWPFPGAAPAPAAPMAAAPVAPVEAAAPPAAVAFAEPAAPAVPTTPVPPTPAVQWDYVTVMTALPARIASGQLTQEMVNNACAAVGLPNIVALSTRPDLAPTIAASLGLA